MTKPTIYFDLDGTLYDLYNVPDWLDRLMSSDPTAYADDNATIHDMVTLHEILYALLDAGYEIGVVTWLAKGSSPEYDKAVRSVKREWIRKFLPMATEIHIVRYGTPKHRIIKNRANAIIVDDDANVREAWKHGLTIDATHDMIKSLKGLMD